MKMAKLLNYRVNYNFQPNIIKDVWDSSNIKNLSKRYITIDGKKLNFKHLEDKRESALALATDGVKIFRSQTKSCWPIFLIDYLVPPQLRTKKSFIIHLGVIPGPSKTKQLFHTFIEPVVDAFKLLQLGTEVYDSSNDEYFLYRGHITHIIGDMPAISKLMGLKGTNSIYPCRICTIRSRKGPKNTYYPSLQPPLNETSHRIQYDINNLPIRGHDEWLKILESLECDSNCNDFGINFRSPLLKLSSIIVPFSFCIDSMYLILENLVNTLWNQLRGLSHEVFRDAQVPGNDVLSNDDLKQIEREIVVS